MESNNKVSYTGEVSRIIYRKEENGWTVFVLEYDDHALCTSCTCVGTTSEIKEHDFVTVTGEWIRHKDYGKQLKAYEIIKTLPTKMGDIEKFLTTIDGIGKTTAKKIVAKYGTDTFRVLENECTRISCISGISVRKAESIGKAFKNTMSSKEDQLFFIKLGITVEQAKEIKKIFGEKFKSQIIDNPYQLISKIRGIGFLKADKIAESVGIRKDSPFRIQTGILHYLESLALQKGHLYYPKEMLVEEASNFLEVEHGLIEEELVDLISQSAAINDNGNIYLSKYYQMEIRCAKRVIELLESGSGSDVDRIIKNIKVVEKELHVELDETQRDAVCESIKNNFLVITGGPGVGKTTTLNIIIKYLQKYETKEIVLLAPTGRAAKRMAEQTKEEASTIHRMIGIGTTDEIDDIETDVIIIDEMSMVDISLFDKLLEHVMDGTKLILVGDVDQIPSVGPGLVLKDLINSEVVPVARLTKIHRQATENHIISNAHKINKAELIELDSKNTDFFFLNRSDEEKAIETIKLLYTKIYPENMHVKSTDIQILTPMKKGELGTENLNRIIQATVNKKDGQKNEIEKHNTIFREGDKVMHIKNNYSLEWRQKNDNGMIFGTGVFNGDMGFIKKIDVPNKKVDVEYDDGKTTTYDFDGLDELMLAYAITIHKSQGSEYPVVILPVVKNGIPSLFNKNVLYTAVTRAKQSVCLVGNKKPVYCMISNTQAEKRYTSLAERLKKLV